jgi:16S rRNA (guanine527-N7)-methyltransferase
VELPATAIDGLRAYFRALEAGNARTNLTRITGEADFLERHALDALLGLPLLPNGPLIDIGSGGGVPGIPLALARPEWQVTLLEAASRKTRFLEEAVAELGLAERVRVVQGRAEEVARQAGEREAYRSVTLRAVSSAATCLELGLPFAEPGGALLLYRGPEADGEDEARLMRVAARLGGAVPCWEARALPSGAARRLIRVAKLKPTPDTYPRRNGVPAKRPLE